MLNIPGPVILDLNSQRDLLSPDGIYPVFQAEKLHDPFKKLFAFAQRNNVPVISTRFNHLVSPGPRDGLGLRSVSGMSGGKLICDPKTEDSHGSGYQKMPFTLLRKRREWPLDCGTDLPIDGFRTTQQFIFDLPGLNLFECPRLDRLLSESTVELFFVAGAPLEWTVRTTVLGLLARRHKVAMISDCLGMWDPYEGDMAHRQIESKNLEWLTVAQMEERFGQAARLQASRAARAARTAARAKARPAQPATMAVKGKPNAPQGRGAFRV
jgi:nicotinamidase-related amidase